MKKILLLLTLLSTSLIASAQQGTLTGKVKDKKTGEPIIGATIAVTGTTKGITTDVEGNYTIPLDPGTYKISATYVSYKPQNLDNVQITAGQPTTLNITMEESATSLAGVTVVGTKQTNTEISLINDIRKSNIVVSGMSAEQIVKSQDRDAAEVVKRIPGITIMDNRFIVVRGLSERYNSVLLNDAVAPSSEIDVRAFSFDLLPTSVIDRVLIYKSPAPELPGDFGGGAIKIYTKNVVNENSMFFGVSSSYRGGTTFRSFNTYEGSNTDLLGFDNGTRKLPNNFPSIRDFQNNLTNQQKADAAKQLPNIWAMDNIKAAPDLRFNFGVNRKFDIGDKHMSSITAISYTNARQSLFINRSNLARYIEGREKEINWQYRDQVSSQGARVGVLQNFALSLNENNKIEFRNVFNQISIDEATIREGFQRDFADEEERNYYLRYESRSVLSSQLQGNHTSANGRNIFTWTGGYNYIARQEPDLRRVRTTRPVGSEQSYEIVIPTSSSSPNNAGRFYSDLNETGIIANGQIDHIFGKLDSTDTDNTKNLRMKAGFYAERRSREFDSRYFGYIFPFNSTANRGDITNAPLNQAFQPNNLSATNGIILDELTRINDRYSASNTLGAAYVSLTKNINNFTFYGGARGEYNLRKVEAEDLSGVANVDDPTFYLLPSINIAYNFNKKSLLRLAYGMTINRPEFREQANFSFYDFIENASVVGNNNLKTATIHNLDMRYEFYPNPTELISIGGFYKKFFDPIETLIIPGSGAAPIYSFTNADNATTFGVETEIRKSLLDLSASKFVQNHSLVLNASLIHSRVTFGQEVTGQEQERPLMGQSPYIINGGLYYQNDDNGWQYSLMYNVLGKRIYRVGSNDGNPTIYEMPRNVMDLTVTKNFKNGFQIRAGVQDILNQASRFIQDSNYDSEITDIDDTVREYKRGTYSTIGVSYNF